MLPSSSATTQSTLLDRGVYRAPFLAEDGRPFLFAIDHDHKFVGKRPFGDGSDSEYRDAKRWLWQLLDGADPLLAAVPILTIL